MSGGYASYFITREDLGIAAFTIDPVSGAAGSKVNKLGRGSVLQRSDNSTETYSRISIDTSSIFSSDYGAKLLINQNQ